MLRHSKDKLATLVLARRGLQTPMDALSGISPVLLDREQDPAKKGSGFHTTIRCGSDISKALNLSASPHSLEFIRTRPLEGPPPSMWQEALLRVGGYYSKESKLMRAATGLYSCVTETATNSDLLRALDIPLDDFQHDHAMLCLHIWMLLVRLRPEGSDGKQLAQLMYDDFQEDVEKRVRGAGVQVRLRKHLVELEKQFYGSCIAYDKTMKDEPTEPLSSALHRNVYQAVQSKQPAASLLERYVKRELACLTMTDSAAVMAGNVRFSFSLS